MIFVPIWCQKYLFEWRFKRKIYICITTGYEKTEKFYKLKKLLHDLKQSSKAWFDRLSIVMRSMNYRQSNSDHTLFIKYDGDKISILLMYMDDVIIIDNDENEITRLRKRLSEEFDIKDLSKLGYFLGMGLLD